MLQKCKSDRAKTIGSVHTDRVQNKQRNYKRTSLLFLPGHYHLNRIAPPFTVFRYLHTIVSGVVYKINICYGGRDGQQYRRSALYPALTLEWRRLMYGHRWFTFEFTYLLCGPRNEHVIEPNPHTYPGYCKPFRKSV